MSIVGMMHTQWNTMKKNKKWKVPVLKELTDVKFNSFDLEGLSLEELVNILSVISSS